MPGRQELPSTLQRSPAKAQRTWIEAHDSAVDTYGEGQRAHRVAYAALKHNFEKVGDHWEAKEKRGPSDQQDANPKAAQKGGDKPTRGGVNAYASKNHLYEQAQRLGVPGRSKMTKAALVDALQQASDTRTSKRD